LLSEIAALEPDLLKNMTEPASGERVFPMPGLGEAYFSVDVSQDVAGKIIIDFTRGSQERGGANQNQNGMVGNAWRFTLKKKFDEHSRPRYRLRSERDGLHSGRISEVS